MRLSIIAIVCLAWGLLATGCKSSNPVAGTWKLDSKSAPSGQIPEVTIDFTEDGKFSLSMASGERSESMAGTYKLEGKSLTMTPTAEGGKPSSDKPETVTLSDDMKSFPVPGAQGMGTMVKQ